MKLRLVIKGRRVQDVGYRLFLLSRAKSIVGFDAQNVGDDLIVFIEGERPKLDEFVKLVKSEKPPSADVGEVLVEDYDGDVMKINDFRSQFSLEQLAKIATVGVELRDDIKEMKGDIKEMKGDIKEILKKQDETIKEIRELRSELKAYMDERFRRLEHDIELIKAKIGLM